MKYNKLYILFCAFIFSVSAMNVHAQAVPKKPDYSAYYYHRKSLFEVLSNTKNEIILLGDSITDGNEWSEMFGSLRVKNRGISGDVTDGILYRLDEVTESNPTKVFIMIGVNDLAAGRSVKYVLANYEKIVDQIQHDSPHTEIYIQSLLPVNDAFPNFPNHTNKLPEIKQSNNRLEALAHKKECTYIDLFDDFTGANGKMDPEYTEDGLHINGKGYLVWKSAIEKYMDLNSR